MHTSRQRAAVVFHSLTVTNIEDSSGIFIGANQAYGWSSYSKSNQGLGSLSNATINHSINVVYDQDVIDAAVEDIRPISLVNGVDNLQQCAIDFEAINVGTVLNNSAIDLGDNKQLGWRSSRKTNYGTSKAIGSNVMRRFASMVMDNDVVDAAVRAAGPIADTAASSPPNVRIRQTPPSDPTDPQANPD